MNQRALFLLGFGVIAGGIGFAVWFLFLHDMDTPLPAPAAAESSDSPDNRSTPIALPDADLVVRTTDLDQSTQQVPDEQPNLLPESFLAQLSGVRGRLVEADGTPIPELDVVLLEIHAASLSSSFLQGFRSGHEQPKIEVAAAESDASGEFLLRGAFPGAFHGLGINLGAGHATIRMLDQELIPGEVTDLGDIVMEPSITLTGKVIGPSGAGIANARVRATVLPSIVFQTGAADFRANCQIMMETPFSSSDDLHIYEIPKWIQQYESRLPIPQTMTGADGTFTLTGAPRGLVSVVADRAGYLAGVKSQPTGSNDTRDVGQILLREGVTISGVVRDSTGSPVPNLEVLGGTIAHTGIAGVAQPCASLTDDGGAFAIRGILEQGPWHVAIRTAHYQPWQVYGPFDAAQNIVLELPAQPDLDVLLRDLDGNVVLHAELQIRENSFLSEIPLLTFHPPRRILPKPKVVEPGTLRISGLTQNEYTLIGVADGFGIATVELKHPSPDGPATLAFPPELKLDVQVMDAATGELLPHARVAVMPEGREPLVLDQQFTDEVGRATLSPLPLLAEQNLYVWANHPGYASEGQVYSSSALAQLEHPLELALHHGGTLRGRVHSGGAALESPVFVAVDPRSRNHVANQVPRFTITDPNGEFLFENLNAGEARYEVIERFLEGDPNLLVNKVFQDDFEPETLMKGRTQIEAGEVTELDLDIGLALSGTPAAVSGVIRHPNPDSRYEVGLGRGDERKKIVGTGEEFRFDDVSPGFVSVQIRELDANQNPSHVLYQKWTELTYGETLRIELELHPFEAQILVVDATTRTPVPHVSVYARPRQWDGLRGSSAATDANGIAKVTLYQESEYALSVSDLRYGRGEATVNLPSHAIIEVEINSGVPAAARLEYDDSSIREEDHLYVQIVRVDSGSRESAGFAYLEPGQRDLELRGLRSGKYTARLGGARRSTEIEFTLPEEGDRHLRFEFQWKEEYDY